MLKSSRCQAGIFKYKIQHKYSAYVHKLDFDESDEDNLLYLLSVVSAPPSQQSLDLPYARQQR